MLKRFIEIINDVKLWLIASLTLGLAPFFPEPHIWGKLKWIMGGAAGMQPIDYLDLLWHGIPFIFLLRILILKIIKK